MATPENEKDLHKEGLEIKAIKRLVEILKIQLNSSIASERKEERIEIIRQLKEIYQLE